MSHYLKKIKRHPLLEKAFSYIIEHNESVNLPYHNTRHLVKVFDSCMEIAKGYKLPEHDLIVLGVAALFHDFNHSGGKLKDNENIQIAVQEFIKFYELNKMSFDGIHFISIQELITYTEFPKTKEPENDIQKILMDCDMIQAFDVDWFLYAINGLSMERGITIKQALEDQTNFINNVSFYTKYAQKLHKKEKKKYSKKLEYLKTIFN